MWLSNSSVGRKVVMSVTGLFLVLFVTFHALMNAVAIFSLDAYECICEFLGANWYAVAGTALLALGFVVHIIYAFWLTLQNRVARGDNRYAVSARPAGVSWASQNMLVLGLIVFCFLLLHLFHFWAKMQLPELMGEHPLSGIQAIETTFGQTPTPLGCPAWMIALPCYLIGFCALWVHISHGFWSAFQTLGTANDNWIPRWKKAATVWATVVFLLFAVEAVYFTMKYAFDVNF